MQPTCDHVIRISSDQSLESGFVNLIHYNKQQIKRIMSSSSQIKQLEKFGQKNTREKKRKSIKNNQCAIKHFLTNAKSTHDAHEAQHRNCPKTSLLH